MRGIIFSLIIFASVFAEAQSPAQFEVDASWPAPLPEGWVNGHLGGSCIDSHDHVAVVDRRNISEKQARAYEAAPPIQMFDREGNLIESFGDPEIVPAFLHGCAFDADDNLYIGGSRDGLIQKYSHHGELLLQIGTKGVVDTTDGTASGERLNASRNGFYWPSDLEIDADNGDIYVSDGYGNRRVVVFDSEGNYLRQWGRQATPEESQEGVGGVFAAVVHCVEISNDELVYVCDREGNRIQIFTKGGDFIRNIWIPLGAAMTPDILGSAWSMDFSADPEQQYIFVMDGLNEKVHIIENASGETVSSFGRAGHAAGHFDFGHTISVDSEGNIYVAETGEGRRIQRFEPSN